MLFLLFNKWHINIKSRTQAGISCFFYKYCGVLLRCKLSLNACLCRWTALKIVNPYKYLAASVSATAEFKALRSWVAFSVRWIKINYSKWIQNSSELKPKVNWNKKNCREFLKMSLIPLLFQDYAPKSHHRFGTPYYPLGNLWKHLWKNNEGFEKGLHIGKDGFEVSLSTQRYHREKQPSFDCGSCQTRRKTIWAWIHFPWISSSLWFTRWLQNGRCNIISLNGWHSFNKMPKTSRIKSSPH